jgi:DDE_Tnp_1-associated
LVVSLNEADKCPADHRQAGKVTYTLDEIVLLCLLAVLAGTEASTDIAGFGEKKLDLLRRFLPIAMARLRMIIWATDPAPRGLSRPQESAGPSSG